MSPSVPLARFWGWTTGLTAALGVAMAATLPTRLGFSLWHYNASFLVALALAGAAWPFLARRRVATLTMAFSGTAATATGLAMLYTRDFPYKEWVTWWHSVTSFVLMLAFLVHWLRNAPRLNMFLRLLAGRARTAGGALAVGWVVLALSAAWTWTAPTNARFTRENYLYLSSWAVLAGVTLAYGAWLFYRLPRLRAKLEHAGHRNTARAAIDMSLLLAHWGVIVTGFALLWFEGPLHAGPLKYVSKWWHTATSVLLVALLALHIGFNARFLAAHARRVDEDLAR